MEKSIPLRSDLNNILPGVKSVIAVGLNYNQEPPNYPFKIARYALGRDYHKVLKKKLKRVTNSLSQYFPNECWRACVDSAPVMEREYAHRAGLGWFGKNTCLINSHRGSWFFIGVLLTSAHLEPDSPSQGGCGTCRACIDACPTGAIIFNNDVWQVDARQCISYLTIEKRGPFTKEEEKLVGNWAFGCDICQEVCPFNQPRISQPLRAQITTELDFLNQRDFSHLGDLLEITPEQWDNLSSGSPIRRTGREGFLRNLKANLKNRL